MSDMKYYIETVITHKYVPNIVYEMFLNQRYKDFVISCGTSYNQSRY